MSNSEIRTTLLHLRDSDDHDDQKFIWYGDFSIHIYSIQKIFPSAYITDILTQDGTRHEIAINAANQGVFLYV